MLSINKASENISYTWLWFNNMKKKMWIKIYYSLTEYLIGYNELIMVGRTTKEGICERLYANAF